MRYGLIGEHLGHSYSPEIHKMLWGCDYELAPMPPDALPAFFARREFQGINVTIPYKQAVLPFCDALGETAKRAGSVNTICKRPDGTLFGDNTDLFGLQYMLQSAGISLEGRHVLVLGGGGASQTAQLAAQDANAASLMVARRSGEVNYSNIYDQCRCAQVIINATPVGMFPAPDAQAVDLARFPVCEAVVDLIYNPLRTKLIQQAKALKLQYVNGLAMLVAQAAVAAEIFTGTSYNAYGIDKVCATMQQKIENWVLIGMPGCGKSTVGAYLAKRAGRAFVDIDSAIEERAGISCSEVIQQKGEAHFRMLESESTKEAGKKMGLVIATGGGTVCKPENVFALRQNGKLLWIRREVAWLATYKRPLSRDLAELERARIPVYQEIADEIVHHNEDWEALQEAAWEAFQ